MLLQTLRADCSQCFALCCVAHRFAASVDFAIDKPAATPCPNLSDDDRCGIHTSLRGRGFRGCTVYDCLGAGQRVAQQTFDGASWRTDAATARSQFAAFDVMKQLHELLWYLACARALRAAEHLHADLDAAIAATEVLTAASASELIALDVDAHWALADPLLRAAGESARAEALGDSEPDPRAGRGADLMGADLRGADLRGADLRGAYLIGADLRGADLTGAELIGADLRDADVRGADLERSLFLTGPQVAAAMGDASTRLPPYIDRPAHWNGRGPGATAVIRL